MHECLTVVIAGELSLGGGICGWWPSEELLRRIVQRVAQGIPMPAYHDLLFKLVLLENKT